MQSFPEFDIEESNYMKRNETLVRYLNYISVTSFVNMDYIRFGSKILN